MHFFAMLFCGWKDDRSPRLPMTIIPGGSLPERLVWRSPTDLYMPSLNVKITSHGRVIFAFGYENREKCSQLLLI
ncbi:unnamed protein product [Victoria cruziana]